MCDHEKSEKGPQPRGGLHVMEYQDSLLNMQTHFEDLCKQRPRNWGHGLKPYDDVMRFQPVIVQAYSLLEQCLKLLIAIRDEVYLDKRDKKKLTPAQEDSHNLQEVFKKLTDIDKCRLGKCYDQYASYIRCTNQFPTLDNFLENEGKSQVSWRYLTLEKGLSMRLVQLLAGFLSFESNMRKVDRIFSSKQCSLKGCAERYPEKFWKMIDFLTGFLRTEGSGKNIQGHNLAANNCEELNDLLKKFLQNRNQQSKTEGKPLSIEALWRMARRFQDNLPSKAHPNVLLGILLELIHCVLNIIKANAYKKPYELEGVSRRLEDLLKEAQRHSYSSLPPDWSEQKFEEFLDGDDLQRWEQNGVGTINAFSKYIRVGVLQKYSDAMREWLNHSIKRLQCKAEHDIDLRRFLDIASRCCVTFDGNRFSFCSNRPHPLSTNLEDWGKGWSIKWEKTKGSIWEGPIDDIPCRKMKDFGLPMWPGQSFRATWGRTKRYPAPQSIEFGAHGQLTVSRNKKPLLSITARCGRPIRSSRTRNAEFVRVDDCHGMSDSTHRNTGYDCLYCKGTGFCVDCLGEPKKGNNCEKCKSHQGLCPECEGYGLSGHHLIARTLDDAAYV